MIRVAVVDGTPADRFALQRILGSDPEILVVGAAGDEDAAFDLVRRTRPEVVILAVDEDVTGPHRVVRQIMAHCPTAILLLVGRHRGHGEMLGRVLAAGALDAMEKPSFGGGGQPESVRRDLLPRVKLLARVPVITHVAGKLRQPAAVRGPRAVNRVSRCAVAIAASTGGPAALAKVLSALPADLLAPLLVVQHIADGFIEGLARWFQDRCSLKVQVAAEGVRVEPGVVLLGPDGAHMAVGKGGVIELDRSPARAGIRPSADRLFASVAAVYGAGSIGVVLTGMGNDGALGAAAIKRAGGRVIAQDEATSAIFGMPRATIEAGAAEEVLPLEAVADRLVEWSGKLNGG